MKLSSKGRYAVLAMVDIAKYADDKPCKLSNVAVRQNISLQFLEQIFLKLKKSNLVKSHRGPGGGYKLSGNVIDTFSELNTTSIGVTLTTIAMTLIGLFAMMVALILYIMGKQVEQIQSQYDWSSK